MRQHYLLVYDRRQGKVIQQKSFARPDEALAARFDAERGFSGQPEIEIVVLGADSWEDLTRTHSRYFKGLNELAERALAKDQ